MSIKRYKVALLRDGRLLAVEQAMARALLLTPAAADGEYRLSQSGSLTARAGLLVSVKAPAACAGYRIELQRSGAARVSRPTEPAWCFTIESRSGSSPGSPSRLERFAILELRPSGYLLATSTGVSDLRVVTPSDGSYPTVGGITLTVRGGTVLPSGAKDMWFYELADDYAP